MLSLVLTIITIAIIAAALLCGVILYFKKSKSQPKSVRKHIIKENMFQFGAFFLALLLTVIYSIGIFASAGSTATAVITLNYAEASLGQNANGTRYNMSEIICSDVLKRVIKKGGLEGVSVSDLKKCFTVAPLIEGNSDSKEDYHISTEFLVSYQSNKATEKYSSETLVELLCNSYRDYYFDKYMGNFNFFDEDYEKAIASLDYYDKADYLNLRANKILNYVYGLQRKNSSFVSSTGATFASVSSKVYNLKSTQINENLSSFILQNGLSNNPRSYVERLEYLNSQSSFERDKESQSYQITNEAVNRYAEEMATVVLVPTRDETGKFYMSRTKLGIDELSVQSIQFSKNLASIQKSMENNALEIEKFTNAAGNTPENRALADATINAIHNNLMKFAEEAREIGQEYYANQMNQGISATTYRGSALTHLKKILVVFVAAYIAFAVWGIGKKFKKQSKVGE